MIFAGIRRAKRPGSPPDIKQSGKEKLKKMDTQANEKKPAKRTRPEPVGNPVIYRACAIFSAILGIAGAVVYAFAYVRDYEPGVMHYRSGSYLIIIAGCLIASSAVAAFAAGIAARGTRAALPLEMNGAAPVFFTLFVGLLFVANIVSVLISPDRLTSDLPGKLALIALIAAGFSAISMILRPFRVGSGAVPAILSLFPAITMGLIIFIYYFDMKTAPINSPEKGMTNVVLSASLLFFLGDTKDRLGRVSPVFAVFTRMTTAFIAAPIAVSRVVLRLTSQLDHPPFIVNVLIAAIGLYALYLLFLTGRAVRVPFKADTEQDQ